MQIGRRATLTISTPKKTVHNSDIKSLAKELKLIKSDVGTRFLGETKGPGTGVVLSKFDVMGKRDKFLANVARVTTKLNSSSYKHNSGKARELDRIKQNAESFFSDAFRKRGRQDSLTVHHQRSKVSSHQEKRERAELMRTTAEW